MLSTLAVAIGLALGALASQVVPVPQQQVGVDTNIVAVSREANKAFLEVYQKNRTDPSCVYGEIKSHPKLGRYLYIKRVELTERCHAGFVGVVAAWTGAENPYRHPVVIAWMNEMITRYHDQAIFMAVISGSMFMPDYDGEVNEFALFYFRVKKAEKPRES